MAALAPCAFAGAIAAEPAITSGVASAPLRNDRREPGAFAVMRISFFVVGPALSWMLQASAPTVWESCCRFFTAGGGARRARENAGVRIAASTTYLPIPTEAVVRVPGCGTSQQRR